MATFDGLTTDQLEQWIRRAYADWQAMPGALSVLAEREGLTYGEMARRLGMHKSTVQRRVRRWRDRAPG